MSSEQTSKFIHNFKKGDIVHFHARTLCEQPLEMVETSAPAIVFYPAGSLGEQIESEGGEA